MHRQSEALVHGRAHRGDRPGHIKARPWFFFTSAPLQTESITSSTSDARRALQRKQFQKMNSIVDNMEALLADAHKAKGWHWVSLEPMWTSWPMEKFGASIHNSVIPARLEI